MPDSLTTLSVEEMLLYCSCPLKYKLWKERPHDHSLTRSDLFSLAAKQAIYTFFNHLADNHRTPTATAKAVRKFDELWLGNEHRLIADPNRGVYDFNLLLTHINSLYDPIKDEVVATQFPIQRTFSGRLLLKDSVDLLLINRSRGSCGKTTYRGIQLGDPTRADNDRYMQLRVALFKSALQMYLGPDTQRHYSYELRPIRGSAKLVNAKHLYYHDLVRTATNVAKAIRLKAWYPTTSKEMCNECPYKRTCTMSLVR